MDNLRIRIEDEDDCFVNAASSQLQGLLPEGGADDSRKSITPASRNPDMNFRSHEDRF